MTPPPLRGLRVASPCSADWDSMAGTDRVRACADCQLNVYNLSAMTAREARVLIRESEGRLCVRFYRRADGTVLTRDCPASASDAVTERRRGAAVALALATLFAASVGVTQAAWSLLASVDVRPLPHDSSVMGELAAPEEFILGDLVTPDDGIGDSTEQIDAASL